MGQFPAFILVAILFGIVLTGGASLQLLTASAMTQQSSKDDLEAAIKLNQVESAKLTRSKSTLERFNTLEKEVADRGIVRVIVRVRAAYDARAELRDGFEARVQRSEIMRIREAVLEPLVGYDQSSVRSFDSLPFLAVSVNATGLAALKKSSDVVDIQEDRINRISLAESVAFIGATNAWASGYTGSGQVVAILDTGVEKTHPMLVGKVVSEACYSSNVPADSATSVCPGGVSSSVEVDSGLPCPTDCEHGTHVAGIAAGRDGYFAGSSFSGVAKDAKIIAIQVFSQFNSCGAQGTCVGAYDSDIVMGLQRVYALRSSFNIASVNMSLGGGRFYSTASCDSASFATKAAIDLLRSANIATVVASGNGSYKDSLSSPACISSAISVGATYDTRNLVTSFSNSAPFLSLLAPGAGITSSIPGGSYATWNGTSMAAPHVAGAWAILKQKVTGATVSSILMAFTSTGVGVTDTNSITKPRISVDTALGAISGNGIPTVPSGLAATSVSSSQINLTWTDNSLNETGFQVERKTGASGNWSTIASLASNTTTYQNRSLAMGTTYYYRVSAINGIGRSIPSNEATATTALAQPSGLKATAVSTTQINLSWTDNSATETGFMVQRRTGNGGWVSLVTTGPNVTTYQSTGLTRETTYSYRIFATNAVKTSDASNEASAKTLLQAPGGLTATLVSLSEIRLNWVDNSATETGFIIQRKTGTSGTWANLLTVGANTVTVNDRGLATNTTYHYRLIASSVGVSSNVSAEADETTVYIFQAESHSHHSIGRREADGWSVRVGDSINRHMNYGPYSRIVNPGTRTATYRLMLDNTTADNNRILLLDVYDAATGRTLASRTLTRRQFTAPFQYQDFDIVFTAVAGQQLEFRTYWYGGSYVRQDYTKVR